MAPSASSNVNYSASPPPPKTPPPSSPEISGVTFFSGRLPFSLSLLHHRPDVVHSLQFSSRPNHTLIACSLPPFLSSPPPLPSPPRLFQAFQMAVWKAWQSLHTQVLRDSWPLLEKTVSQLTGWVFSPHLLLTRTEGAGQRGLQWIPHIVFQDVKKHTGSVLLTCYDLILVARIWFLSQSLTLGPFLYRVLTTTLNCISSVSETLNPSRS